MLSQDITSLNALMGGALLEKFTDAIKSVTANILDTNTDPKKARTITIKTTIKPSEQRDTAIMECNVDVKLAPAMPSSSSVIIGMDIETGEVQMSEITNQLPGQIFLDGSVQEQKKVTIK